MALRPPSPSRLVAARVLLAMPDNPGRDAATLLDAELAAAGPEGRDARLATTLVMQVLRRATLLDMHIEPLLSRPAAGLDPRARVILRLAAAQHLLLDRVPPHAIVDDSVRLAYALGMTRHEAGFVNAVARQLVQRTAEDTPPPDDLTPAEQIGLACSLPPWIAKLMLERFGTADSLRLADALAAEPTVTLRTNRLRTTPANLAETLAAAGINTQPGLLLPDALRLAPQTALTDLLATPAFTDGLFYIQDEASQAVAHAVAPAPGEAILDLCAAPGGKATHLAELAGGKANVVASDISAPRLEFVRQNVARLGTPGLTILSPEEALGAPGGYDAVLVDAPCSALGTLRRHPEVRLRLSRAGLRAAAALQNEILDQAVPAVRPGGRLVYSTCSFTKAENGDVVYAFLERNPDFHLAEPGAWPPHLRSLRGDYGIARTWPQWPDLDGFEIALFHRDPAKDSR